MRARKATGAASANATAANLRTARGRSRPARIGRRLTASLLGLVLIGLVWSIPSLADNVVVTPTNVMLANANGTTPLTGTTVSGFSNPSQPLLVSVSTTIGSLSISQTSGLTLSYGYSSFSGSSFSFVGDQADVQNGLASLSLVGTGTTGTAAVTVTVTANQNGIAYLPTTGHYYEFVPNTTDTWTQAQSDATSLTFDSQRGYLASIPNASVNTFIQNHLNGARNVWAGGMSVDYPSGKPGDTNVQRAWSWQSGPLAGTIFTQCSNVAATCSHYGDSGDYADWNTGEPNNYGWSSSASGSGEHYLEINYLGTGNWNDIPNSTTIAGYVVEFGSSASDGGFTGVYSGTANVTLATVPGQPTGVSAAGAAATGGEATVSWLAPANSGNQPITGYTVTASSGGRTCTWNSGPTHCTLTGLTNGTTYTFTVTPTNSQGASAPSSQSNSTVVLAYPTAPVISAPADLLDTSNNEPAFTGTGGAPNGIVTIYLNGNSIGTAPVDGSGNWSFTPSSPIADGNYTFDATTTDPWSNISPVSSGRTLQIDTAAPNTPTVTAPADGSVSNDTSPTITVTGEPDSFETVEIDGIDYGPVQLDGSGDGRLPIRRRLSAGQHSVRVRLTDGAGNVGAWSATSVWAVKLSTAVALAGPT